MLLDWSRLYMLISFLVISGIEEQVRNIQAKKQALKENISEEPEKQRVGLGAGGHFDTDIYGSTRSKFEGYHTYIAPNEDAEVSLRAGDKNSTHPLLITSEI